MAAPLLIGAHITKLSVWDLATYSNEAVIAVSQDLAGSQGGRVAGGGLPGAAGNCGGGPPATGNSDTNVWARPVQGGSLAVILVNSGNATATVSTLPNHCRGGVDLRLVESTGML